MINMADGVEEVPDVAATQPEPDLTYIKPMQVDIQTTVATIDGFHVPSSNSKIQN